MDGESDQVSLQRLATLAGVHACWLIEEQQSLASAAEEIGFCDQSHMTRVFLSVTGMTPSRFRQTARG